MKEEARKCDVACSYIQQAKRMTLIKLRMIVDGGERIKNFHSNKLYWLLAAAENFF
jgi:hypothetical protein